MKGIAMKEERSRSKGTTTQILVPRRYSRASLSSIFFIKDEQAYERREERDKRRPRKKKGGERKKGTSFQKTQAKSMKTGPSKSYSKNLSIS